MSNRNSLILVVGMHRSLTSCIASMVHHAYGAFYAKSEDRLAPNARNRLGYFESKRVYRLNEAILEADGQTWRTVQTQPFVSLEQRNSIQVTLQEHYADRPVSVIKDPRLCVLAAHWHMAARELYETDQIFIIYVIRHPAEVVCSLRRAWGMAFREGLDLWMYYNSQVLYFLSTLPESSWAAVDMGSGDCAHFESVLARVGHELGLELRVPCPSNVYSERERHFTGEIGGLSGECANELAIAAKLYSELASAARTNAPFSVDALGAGEYHAQG